MAELRSEGGGGHASTQNLSGGGAKVEGMFCPLSQKVLTTGPPKMGASGQYLCQIASEHPEMCKIFKIFRLRWAYKGRTYLSGDFVIFLSTKSNVLYNLRSYIIQ